MTATYHGTPSASGFVSVFAPASTVHHAASSHLLAVSPCIALIRAEGDGNLQGPAVPIYPKVRAH